MLRTDKSKRNFYLDEIFGQKDELLQAIQQATKKEGVERMQISPHEARILQFLVQISQSKKIVEIGTLYAYSTLNMARVLPKEGQIWTLDLSLERHKISQEILKKSPDYKKIKWIHGQALETLQTIENQGPFDMIFIDADKGAYMNYLLWAEKNLGAGALLVADNSFLFGAVYGEADRSQTQETIEVMKEFNKRLSHSVFWRGALIPTTEGLTVGIKQGK